MTMEATAWALGALERNPAVCVELLAPLKRMTALQVGSQCAEVSDQCRILLLMQGSPAFPALRVTLHSDVDLFKAPIDGGMLAKIVRSRSPDTMQTKAHNRCRRGGIQPFAHALHLWWRWRRDI